MATDLAENMVVAERFRLIKPVGRGQMGSVWLGHHLGLDILCAIKFIDRNLSDHGQVRARLEREARAQAQLRSPHIVHIFDYGVWRGTPYLAMEFLHGETLAARLERVGRLDWATTHKFVAHIARALTKAHAAGIIHRDLKPENVFLVPDEEEGEIAKVVDFGVAKLMGYAQATPGVSGTHAGALVGTPLFMSPEQARGTTEVDHRSDVWSLGVIAFQCLTGKLPFYSEALGDLLSKILFDPAPQPSAYAPELPADIDAWWARAAARDPDQRFSTARELADALGAALGVCSQTSVSVVNPAVLSKISQPPPAQVSVGLALDGIDASHPAVERGSLFGSRSGGPRGWLADRARRVYVGSAAAGLLAIAAVVAIVAAKRRAPPAGVAAWTGGSSITATAPADPHASAGTAIAAPQLAAREGDPAASSTPPSAAPGPSASASIPAPPARRPILPEELPIVPPPSSAGSSTDGRPGPSSPAKHTAPKRRADPLDGRK